MSNKIKAVIFDMDGVLIDAKEWHFEALNKALALFGMQISRYDHLITYNGLPTKRKLEMLSMERGLPVDLHEFINELKQQYTVELIHAKCRPQFNHQYALSSLCSMNIKVAVCSNSIYNTVELMMQKADLSRYLEFFLSNQDVKNGKPDPEMYIKAIDKLGLHPKECLVVEDNQNGILAAKRAGANIMQVMDVEDVNLENIVKQISIFENMEQK